MRYAVTGSAGGIGRAITRRIHAAGHQVLGIDLRNAEVIADLATTSGRARAAESVRAWCDGRLDGMVFAAGISSQSTPSQIASVNYFGVVDLLEALRAEFESAQNAAAVIISSNSATVTGKVDASFTDALLNGNEHEAIRLGDTLDGLTLYASSKYAVTRAARRCAVKWAQFGTRVNVIMPGLVRTPMLEGALEDASTSELISRYPQPIGRVLEADEIAEAVWFLLTPASAAMLGAVLFVDGGGDAMARPDEF